MPEDIPPEQVAKASKKRRRLFFLSVAVAGLSILVVALIWAGPLFSGALFLSRPTGRAPVSHDLPDAYAPKHKGGIDFATGLYIREDEDLVLRHTPPFALTRTYLSGDRVSRQFGVGATNNGEWYLIGDLSDLSWAELILADGARVHFNRTSLGRSFRNAVFVHRTSPSMFYGSRLGWTGLDWVLRFQDGGIARFRGCGPGEGDLCSLTLLRDADGHVLEFQRDLAGRLVTIEAPTERIALDYDASGRVIRAGDSSGHVIGYTYDARGRLERVSDGSGAIRSYTYDDRDEMLSIREPGKLITNTFDAQGRVTRQVTLVSDSEEVNDNAEAYVIEFAYTVSGGSVTETDVKGYDGTHSIYRFNPNHYVKEEVRDAQGKQPITVSYERDWTGQIPLEVRVRCSVNGHPVSDSASLEGGDPDVIERDLIQRTCTTATLHPERRHH